MGEKGNWPRMSEVEREVRWEREKVSLDHLRRGLCANRLFLSVESEEEIEGDEITHFAC